MSVTRDSVLKILANEANLNVDRLNPNDTLMDLDISSIDIASAIFALEDEVGIEIEPESISPDLTLNQFLDIVMKLSGR